MPEAYTQRPEIRDGSAVSVLEAARDAGVTVVTSVALLQSKLARGLPNRIHEVTARQVAKARDRIALVEDGASWSYRDLDQRVGEIATVLSSLGIRPGDRMIIVSENCIALAALVAMPLRRGRPNFRRHYI